MKIQKKRISILSEKIFKGLLLKGYLLESEREEEAKEAIEELLFQEILLEENLEKEVRTLLAKYDQEIDKGNVDYRRLFELTKRKLAKEKNIVL